MCFVVSAVLLLAFSPYAQEAGSKNETDLEETAEIPFEEKQPEKKRRLYFGAKDEIRTRIISVDLDYLTMGLTNSGWGLLGRLLNSGWNCTPT